MNTYLKYKPLWLQFVLFGTLVFGIYLVVALGGVYVIAAQTGLPIGDLMTLNTKVPGIIPALKLLQMLFAVGLFLIPSLIYAYLADREPVGYLGLRRPHQSAFWLIGIVGAMASLPVVDKMAQWNQAIHLPAALKEMEASMRAAEAKANELIGVMMTMKSPVDLWANLLLFALIPAITEEVFFRGILQRFFIQMTRSPWMGILIGAALFSALHGQFLGFFPRMALGIFLGMLYWHSTSLWPGIVAHLLFNGVQVVAAFYFNTNVSDNFNFPFWTVGLGAVIWLASMLYIRKISTAAYYKVYESLRPEDDFIA